MSIVSQESSAIVPGNPPGLGGSEVCCAVVERPCVLATVITALPCEVLRDASLQDDVGLSGGICTFMGVGLVRLYLNGHAVGRTDAFLACGVRGSFRVRGVFLTCVRQESIQHERFVSTYRSVDLPKTWAAMPLTLF